MINVTNQLKTESLLNSNYYVTANAMLRDGTTLNLEKEDFYLDGNGIVDSSDSGDFPIGVAIEKQRHWHWSMMMIDSLTTTLPEHSLLYS